MEDVIRVFTVPVTYVEDDGNFFRNRWRSTDSGIFAIEQSAGCLITEQAGGIGRESPHDDERQTFIE